MKRQSSTPRPRCCQYLAWWLAAMCVVLVAAPVAGQNGSADPPAPQAQPQTEPEPELEGPPIPVTMAAGDTLPSVDEIDQRIAALRQVDPRNESQSAELAALESTRAFLDRAEQSRARTQSLQQDAANAPQRLQTVQADRTKVVDQPLLPELLQGPLSEAESQLQQARTTLDTEKRLRDAVEAEASNRAIRRRDIPTELAANRARLEEITGMLDEAPPSDVTPAAAAARRLALRAERVALTARIVELEQELRSYDARVDLLTARRSLAELRVQVAERQVNRLEQLVSDKRAAAAEKARQEADQAARDARRLHPALQAVAEQNAALAAEKVDVTERSSSLTDRKQQVESQLSQLMTDFRKIREQVQAVGLNEAIGLRLRTMRAQLPDARQVLRELDAYNDEISRVVLRNGELSDQLALQFDLRAEAIERLRRADVQQDDPNYDALLQAIENALAEQNDKYLKPLAEAYDEYFNDPLTPLSQIESRLVIEIEQFSSYINERILWIQSAAPLSVDTFANAWESARWLIGPNQWSSLLAGLWHDVRTNIAPLSVLLLIVISLLVLRRRMAQALIDVGDVARSVFKANFSQTMMAVGLTILISLPWPLLLLIIGWRLRNLEQSTEFTGAIGSGVFCLAAPLFVVLFVWHMCRRKGLGWAHFRWQQAHLRITRQVVQFAAPIALPLLFIMTVLENQSVDARNDSLGRLAFLAIILVLSITFAWLLSPTRGILHSLVENNPNGWLARLRLLWFPLLAAVPIVLAVVAALGYYYTAQQLQVRLVYMARLILGVLVVYALLQRWLHLAQRRVAIAEATRQAERATTASPDGHGESRPPLDLQGLDVAALSTQTMKLLRTILFASILIGTLVIWAEIVPAFNMLRSVTLWSEDGTPALVETDPAADSDGIATLFTGDSGSSSTAEPSVDATPAESQATRARVTLADLVYALFILVLTIIIARDVPGLLEFVVLQRLPITYGARYAISTVTRYAIVIIGVVLSFNAIGIGWSKVQFLAAAITVGLGFGLQEIFANFVSGLIILFERPIRVGDTVTVGQISGTVSRIRMRATTITDWDRKELIIPNKEFVTGQIVNWSLTDSVLRLRIAVGIAYGSDTVRAKETLLRVAQECEFVIDDPPPRALFLGFGDNSLNFELRAFIGNIDNYLTTIDYLHKAIDDAFRKEKITIAFPQRDLHIVSYPPELAGLRRGDSDTTPQLPADNAE